MLTARRVPLSPIVPGEQALARDLGSYLVKVLRLRAGDVFVVFDPEASTEADAELTSDVPARARLGEPRPAPPNAARELCLLQGLAKGEKPDHVARAAVALGVTALSFVRTDRSIAGAELRHERLRSIMIDTARQCGRGDLPRLAGPLALEVALEQASGIRYVLEPRGQRSLLAALSGEARLAPLTLAVGPEGGFSETELQALEKGGFEAVRLAGWVLRTELAAVSALAVVAAYDS